MCTPIYLSGVPGDKNTQDLFPDLKNIAELGYSESLCPEKSRKENSRKEKQSRKEKKRGKERQDKTGQDRTGQERKGKEGKGKERKGKEKKRLPAELGHSESSTSYLVMCVGYMYQNFHSCCNF